MVVEWGWGWEMGWVVEGMDPHRVELLHIAVARGVVVVVAEAEPKSKYRHEHQSSIMASLVGSSVYEWGKIHLTIVDR